MKNQKIVRSNKTISLRTRYAVLTATALMSIAVAPAIGATRNAAAVTLEIPAQPLSDALNAFAQQSGLQILFHAEAGQELTAPALTGTFTPVAALQRLLANTALEYEFVDERTVAIRPIDSKERLSGAASTDGEAASGLRLANNDVLQHLVLAQSESSSSYPTNEGSIEEKSVRDMSREPERLEEIIVSAQKREERVQDVPISIAVLSGKQLDNAVMPSAIEALRAVPGFDSTSAQGGTFVSVRGVANNRSGAGTVAYYIDGVPFGFIRVPFYPDPSVYDLDRIEVLAGPQGTLYGANALNGVVRVLTNNADASAFEFKARALTSMTEDGDPNTGADMALNIPLIEDRLAVRLVAGYADLGGWVDADDPPPASGVMPLGRDVNSAESRNYRIKVHAQPTNRLSVDLSAWRNEIDQAYGDLSFDDRTSIIWRPTPSTMGFTTYGLTVRQEFAAFDLTSMTSYIDYEQEGIASGLAFGPDVDILEDTRLTSEVFAQELNLVSSGNGSWRWSAGLFYRDASETNAVTYEFPGEGFFPVTNQTDESESYAVFGEIGRDLTDALALSVGLRYFNDEEVMVTRQEYADGPTTIAAGTAFPKTSEALTPRIILTWTPNENLSAYASYSQGFRSGFAQAPRTQSVFPNFPGVDPDRLTNYELGVKGQQDRLSYEAALFYMDWQDAQQTLIVQLPNHLATDADVNTAGASGIGASFSLRAELFEGFEASLGASWNDLTFDADLVDANGGVLFRRGDRPNLSPAYTASASAEYTWELGGNYSATFGLSGNYRSPQNTTELIAGNVESDSVTLLNSRLTLEAPEHWSLSIFGENLADENSRIWEYTPAPTWVEHPRPRTVGIQIDYRY